MTVNDLPAKLRIPGVKIWDRKNPHEIKMHLSDTAVLEFAEINKRPLTEPKQKAQ